MWYFALVYFNWVIAIVIWVVNRSRKGKAMGLYPIAVGSALQLIALYIHLRELYKLVGEPDQLYVWIPPLFIAVPAFVLTLWGVFSSFVVVGGADPKSLE